MTFQIKHTKQNLFGRSSTKIFAVFLLILVFVLIFTIFGSTRSLASDFFSIFFKSGDYFYKGLGSLPKFFSDKNQLIEENQKLIDEIENNHFDLINYETIKNENDKLRETLKIKPAGNFIVSAVIAKPPQIPLDSLFLDKGTAAGLQNGNLVLGSDRVLIGKIAEISKNKSTVALNSFVGVISYGFVERTDESLEIKGVGGGNMEVKVPIDFDVMVGDKLMVQASVTYLIAVVQMVEEDSSSGFKNILMSLPVNISKVSMIFIETNTNE